MGNKPIKLKDSIIIDRLIIDCFKDSDLEIPVVEINKLKVHFREGEIFFNFKFDYLIYYSNKIFHDGLPSLYDNYIAKVEQFSSQNKKSEKIFTIFIDFEQDFNFEEDELEFEPIFTIVFEKLEIKNISCFYFNKIGTEYVSTFFEQLYENIFFYKDQRNYDSLYFLMPNTDYFIKNENYLLYLGQYPEKVSKGKLSKIKFNSFKSPFNGIVFNTNYFFQLLSLKTPSSSATKKILDFLNKIKSLFYIKYISEINFDITDKLKFIKIQKKFYDFHNLLCSKTSNIELIFITKNALNNDNVLNLSNLVQYIITNCQNSSNITGLHLIRIVRLDLKSEEGEEEELEENDKEQNNNNIKINEDKNNAFFILDKFIHIILNLLKDEKFSKKRKLIIEYYNLLEVKLPKNEIENNQKIEKIITTKNEVFVNNLQEKDIEDTDIKENTTYKYIKEKLVYEWFVKDIFKLKLFIIYILDIKLNQQKNSYFKKLNFKENEEIKNDDMIKIKKNIFSYIFQEKSSKYFFAKYTKDEIQSSEAKFERVIFE